MRLIPVRVAAWRQRRQARQREPGSALFHGLRLRLAFWYGGVLAAALLLVGVGIYVSLGQLLLRPVKSEVAGQLQPLVQQWTREPDSVCGEPSGWRFGGGPPLLSRTASLVPIYIACFGPGDYVYVLSSGTASASAQPPAAFLDTSLVAAAIQRGSATDIVNVGPGVGMIYRAAQVVNAPSGDVVGVVQVGRSVQEQEAALRSLRDLLLVLGGLAVLVATVGGLFLANRALIPARLAFARQQTFVADASHELRTPLSLLRANAEVLLRRRDRFSADDAAMLEDIVTETGHMDRLATNLLTLARLDAGRLHLEYEVIDLSELACDVVRRVATVAAEKGVSVQTVADSKAVLVGDRQAVERATVILVDNAIKYTPDGGSVTLQTGADDARVSLAVKDTGVGIAPEHLPRITERFYRVDRARARESGGAGLGLAIAQGIAAAHGGTLRIESRLGQGTTATLTFPAKGPVR